jgi:hypothetical protein
MPRATALLTLPPTWSLVPLPAPPGRSWTGHHPRHHNGSYVFPGRGVLSGDWPHLPEVCGWTGPGEWVGPGDDAVLICPGCGLDET